MPKTLLRPKLFSKKPKQNHKLQLENITSILPPILQIIKQKFLPANDFLIYKRALKILN